MKLHHVQLAIPPGSEDKCRVFYCKLLGWRELEKPRALVKRGGLWLHTGDAEVHLGVEENFKPAKKAHPAFLIDDVSSLAETLETAGYEPSWDDLIPEFQRFFVFDAVGNRLEFIQISP